MAAALVAVDAVAVVVASSQPAQRQGAGRTAGRCCRQQPRPRCCLAAWRQRQPTGSTRHPQQQPACCWHRWRPVAHARWRRSTRASGVFECCANQSWRSAAAPVCCESPGHSTKQLPTRQELVLGLCALAPAPRAPPNAAVGPLLLSVSCCGFAGWLWLAVIYSHRALNYVRVPQTRLAAPPSRSDRHGAQLCRLVAEAGAGGTLDARKPTQGKAVTIDGGELHVVMCWFMNMMAV